MQENESNWLSEAQNGDPQAFSCLVETYEKPVYNLCYRMLWNVQDAEDAAQETFLRAYQSIRRFDRNRPFSTWLLSIAAHYCIDQIRKRRMHVVSVEDLADPDIPEPSPGIEMNLSRKEERQRIRAVLGTLDPIDRAAVVMYYWYDFSYEEICQTLSLTTSALKSRMHRARRAMAEEWLKQQQSPPQPIESRSSSSAKLVVERMVS